MHMGVHAPYNFVPLSTKIIQRYDKMEDLPGFDRLDPELKTGEIKITLTAKTPVFISNGEKQEKSDFYKNSKGEYEIPGSTIRGLIRENIQILGLGLFRPEMDLEDYQIYFRDMASSKKSVNASVKQHYTTALNVETKRVGKKSVSIPQNVRAGYIHKNGNSYYIQPVKGEYLRVSRNNESLKACFRNGVIPSACTLPVYYKATDKEIKQIYLKNVDEKGLNQGMFLSTGKPLGQPNHLYVFPEEDADANSIDVSDEDILSYKKDFENRYNSLKAYDNVNFWNLPKTEEGKPVFYIRYNGHIYFGMSLFVRIGYPHSIAEGLVTSHKTRLEKEIFLDYAASMMGFANSKGISYRSRISVDGFTVNGAVNNRKPEKLILGEPKPSYYPGYIKDGKSYIDDSFEIRGYKHYWLKNPEVVAVEKENVASWLKPLPAGTSFTGVIRYRNLHEDELGLLLWAIRLEKDCYQSVGMGKPYGYGCMKIQIDDMKEYIPSKLYAVDSLKSKTFENSKDRIENYIEKYKKYATMLTDSKKRGQSIDENPTIKDFMFIHRVFKEKPSSEYKYMNLEEYQKQRKPLPQIRDFREMTEEAPKENPVESDDLILNGLIGAGMMRPHTSTKNNQNRKKCNKRG